MSYPVFISKGTADFGTSTSISFTYMSTQSNDMIFLFALSEGAGTITADGSWSLIASNTFGADSAYKLYYKSATGAESGTEAVTRSGHTASTLFFAQVYQMRQSSLGCIFESSAVDGDVTDAIDWGSVTVGGSSRTLLAFSANVNEGDNAGPGSGYTNSASDTTSGTFLKLDTKENTASGAATSTTSGSSEGWATIHVSIYGLTISNRVFIVN